MNYTDTLKLTDREMRDFIMNGQIKVQTDFPLSFHENIYRQKVTNTPGIKGK